MRTLKAKPFSLFVFATLALVMSGCGKSNSNTTPVVPGVVNGQYNTIPGGYNGQLSGIGGALSGTLYVDSANVLSFQGPSYTCPGTEMLNMIGQSAYGQVIITGQRTNCSAPANVQVQLSAAAAQQAALAMGLNGTIGSVTISSVNLGRYGSTLYGGTVRVLINGSFPYDLYF
ncbi:MAG: hypothetical protein JST04_04890 [Bdellovibrionales bacterium]|nr:hypothetical protein [Bdellovibrionales bacterium]